MQEVRARGGELYVFADADSKIVSAEGMHVIRMPEHYGMLSPILHTVPLQLLSYHTACARHGRGQAAQSGQERDGGVRRKPVVLVLNHTSKVGRRSNL